MSEDNKDLPDTEPDTVEAVEDVESTSDDDSIKKVKVDKADFEYELDTKKYPVREWKVALPYFKRPIAMNPLVSLMSVIVLWGVAIWSIGMSCACCCASLYFAGRVFEIRRFETWSCLSLHRRLSSHCSSFESDFRCPL